jgi:hypothetical protein
MKPMKRIVLILNLLFAAVIVIGQVPAGFSYQAVVRNSSGEIVTNRTVKFQFSILQNSPAGTPVYKEIHSKATNEYGLVNLVVGSGTKVSGNFNSDSWGDNLHFLKVELDPNNGNTFTHLGTMQLMAVPYAFHAKTVEEISDNSVTSAKIASSVVTEAKIASGAVTGTKIAQAGATSGQVLKWSGTNWAPGDDNAGGEFTLPLDKTGNVAEALFKITNSNNSTVSVTIHGVSTSGYGVKGESTQGHGIYGLTTAPNHIGVLGKSENLASITGTGVWGETNSSQGSGVKGLALSKTGSGIGVTGMTNATDGIAIYGYSYSKTGVAHGVYGETASINGYGVYGLAPNVGIKGEATATSGSSIGLHGVSKAPDGYGVYAEVSHTSGTNTGVKGISHSSSGYGVIGSAMSSTGKPIGIRGFVMSSSGYSGYFNGGRFHVSGRVGIREYEPQAGLHLKGASFPNSFMYIQSDAGQDAGFRLYEGTTEKWHIFNNSASGGLSINNNAYSIAIFAKQSNAFVGLGTTAPTQKLHVVGNAYKTEGGTSWATSSDLRLKTLLGNYEKGLDEISALQPVRFRYLENNPRELQSDIEQVGLVAQDVQKIFPEAVSEAEDGYLDFNIHAINIALVNAVKELKDENDMLKAENSVLKNQISNLCSRMEKIEISLGGVTLK